MASATAQDLKEKGNRLFLAKRYAAAAEKYKSALSAMAHPASTTSDLKSILHSNLAECYLRLGFYREAKTVCKACLNDDPENIKARFRLALAQEAIGEFSAARDHLERLVRMGVPQAADAHSRMREREDLRAGCNRLKKAFLFTDAAQSQLIVAEMLGRMSQALQHDWFIDCFRKHCAYTCEGSLSMLGVGGKIGAFRGEARPALILKDFLHFCKHAIRRELLPGVWNWEALLRRSIALLPNIVDLQSHVDKWGERQQEVLTGTSVMVNAAKVILTGHGILGPIDFSSHADDPIEKSISMELKQISILWPRPANLALVAPTFTDVGGVQIWQELLFQLVLAEDFYRWSDPAANDDKGDHYDEFSEQWPLDRRARLQPWRWQPGIVSTEHPFHLVAAFARWLNVLSELQPEPSRVELHPARGEQYVAEPDHTKCHEACFRFVQLQTQGQSLAPVRAFSTALGGEHCLFLAGLDPKTAPPQVRECWWRIARPILDGSAMCSNTQVLAFGLQHGFTEDMCTNYFAIAYHRCQCVVLVCKFFPTLPACYLKVGKARSTRDAQRVLQMLLQRVSNRRVSKKLCSFAKLLEIFDGAFFDEMVRQDFFEWADVWQCHAQDFFKIDDEVGLSDIGVHAEQLLQVPHLRHADQLKLTLISFFTFVGSEQDRYIFFFEDVFEEANKADNETLLIAAKEVRECWTVFLALVQGHRIFWSTQIHQRWVKSGATAWEMPLDNLSPPEQLFFWAILEMHEGLDIAAEPSVFFKEFCDVWCLVLKLVQNYGQIEKARLDARNALEAYEASQQMLRSCVHSEIRGDISLAVSKVLSAECVAKRCLEDWEHIIESYAVKPLMSKLHVCASNVSLLCENMSGSKLVSDTQEQNSRDEIAPSHKDMLTQATSYEHIGDHTLAELVRRSGALAPKVNGLKHQIWMLFVDEMVLPRSQAYELFRKSKVLDPTDIVRNCLMFSRKVLGCLTKVHGEQALALQGRSEFRFACGSLASVLELASRSGSQILGDHDEIRAWREVLQARDRAELCKQAARSARKCLRKAQRDWEDADEEAKRTWRRLCRAREDLDESNDLDNYDCSDIQRFEHEHKLAEDSRTRNRKDLASQEKLYAKLRCQLWDLQEHLCPELLVELEEGVNEETRIAVRDLRSIDRVHVEKAWHRERRLRQYSDVKEWRCGRHDLLLALNDNGHEHVLKQFRLNEAFGLPALLREVRLLKRLGRHPNIVPLLGFFIEKRCGYLEFLRYPMDLADWSNTANSEKPTRLSVAINVLQGVAFAVSHIHSLDFVHGDLKPQNFLIQEVVENDFESCAPLLCDFESAREFEMESLMRNKGVSATPSTLAVIAGTEGFIAPELCLDGRLDLPRDPRVRPTKASDVYSLGRTLAYVLNGSSMKEVLSDVQELVDISSTMVCHEPGSRPTTDEVTCNAIFRSAAEQEEKRRAEFLKKKEESIELRRECLEKEALLVAERIEAWEIQRACEAAETAATLEAVSASMQTLHNLRLEEVRLKQQLREAQEEVQTVKKASLDCSIDPPPPDWNDGSLNGAFRLHAMSHDEVKPMIARFRKLLRNAGCGDPRCKKSLQRVRLVDVLRVENPNLWRSFAVKRAEIRESFKSHGRATSLPYEGLDSVVNPDINEVHLWHGCSPASAHSIARWGFDERSAARGGLYGMGNYFTDMSCKALQYARGNGCSVQSKLCNSFICSCQSSGEGHNLHRNLLYCRVVLGDPFVATGPMKGFTRPPLCGDSSNAGRRHDSIVANPGIPNGPGGNKFQQHREFVIWNHQGAQAYPEYILNLELS